MVINSTSTRVEGAPLFPYRGVMLDTGRHYEPVAEILQLLDGMAASSLKSELAKLRHTAFLRS